jgi:hypothetical protein
MMSALISSSVKREWKSSSFVFRKQSRAIQLSHALASDFIVFQFLSDRNVIGMCAGRLRAQGGRGGVEMNANAVGFAVALPLFLVIAVGIAVWVHRMRG